MPPPDITLFLYPLTSIKLTDFGGSRPVSQAAKKMISDSAKNAFSKLRDGDWKTQKKKKSMKSLSDNLKRLS